MILLMSVRLEGQMETEMEAEGEGVGLRMVPVASLAEASVAIDVLHESESEKS